MSPWGRQACKSSSNHTFVLVTFKYWMDQSQYKWRANRAFGSSGGVSDIFYTSQGFVRSFFAIPLGSRFAFEIELSAIIFALEAVSGILAIIFG